MANFLSAEFFAKETLAILKDVSNKPRQVKAVVSGPEIRITCGNKTIAINDVGHSFTWGSNLVDVSDRLAPLVAELANEPFKMLHHAGDGSDSAIFQLGDK